MAVIPCLSSNQNDCVKIDVDPGDGGLTIDLCLDRPQGRFDGMSLLEAMEEANGEPCLGNPRSALHCGPNGLWTWPSDRIWCIKGNSQNGFIVPIPTSGNGPAGSTVQTCFENPDCTPVDTQIQMGLGPVQIQADDGDHIQVGFDFSIDCPDGSSQTGRPFVEFKSGADGQCIIFPSSTYIICNPCGVMMHEDLLCVQATPWYNVVSGTPTANILLGGVNTSIWAHSQARLN